MKNKINLHIGYNKTGTTSLQKTLAASSLHFKFLGRRYDESREDIVVSRLAKAVATFKKSEITNAVDEIDNIISLSPEDRYLISHENLLRPSFAAIEGLNFLISLLKERYELKIFLSVRPIESLILSLFKHNLGTIKGWERFYSFLPLILVELILNKSLVRISECNWPYCVDTNINCVCGAIKKIPVQFYMPEYVTSRIRYPIYTCDLTSEDDPCRDQLIFNMEGIFPLPKMNVTRYKFNNQADQRFLSVIRRKIENCVLG